MQGEIYLQFIALLSPFDRAQGSICGRNLSNDLKSQLDPAALVASCKINATNDRAHCNEGLAITSGEDNVRSIIPFVVLLTAQRAFFADKKSVKSPEIPPQYSSAGCFHVR